MNKKNLIVYIIGVIILIFIISKVGPSKLIEFLKKEGLNMNQSTITVFFDKMISLFVKVILGLVGAIFILKQFNFLFMGIPLITLFIIILIVRAVSSKKFMRFRKR